MSNPRPADDYLDLGGVDQMRLLGPRDANLATLEARLGVSLAVRGDKLFLRGGGEATDRARGLLTDIIERVRTGQVMDEMTLEFLCKQDRGPADQDPAFQATDDPLLYASGSRTAVRVKTAGQQAYVQSIREHDVVFSVGPAGTGKTFLAVVMAMDYLKRQLVDRIVLVRPAVEAGEQLGFLPGDLQEKINPYLRPLYDALADITGTAKIAKYMSTGVIEASPLAYMRGRTLNNSFVILDEAQNTTVGQMKMFLTRLGFQSKAVVTGDITQIDLTDKSQSGLVRVRSILKNTDGVAFVELSGQDVVRHPLVRRIVDAFASADENSGGE